MPTSILHVGLPLNDPSIPFEDRSIVMKRLIDLRQSMRDAGYIYDIVHVSPANGLEDFKNLLREQPCDGVIIGGGVVSNPELASFQQQIVEAVHEAAPQAIIMLHDHAEEVASTVRRCLGEPSRQAT